MFLCDYGVTSPNLGASVEVGTGLPIHDVSLNHVVLFPYNYFQLLFQFFSMTSDVEVCCSHSGCPQFTGERCPFPSHHAMSLPSLLGTWQHPFEGAEDHLPVAVLLDSEEGTGMYRW